MAQFIVIRILLNLHQRAEQKYSAEMLGPVCGAGGVGSFVNPATVCAAYVALGTLDTPAVTRRRLPYPGVCSRVFAAKTKSTARCITRSGDEVRSSSTQDLAASLIRAVEC